MKRSKHNLSNYNLFTGEMGNLIPIGLQEVVPGDSFQHSTSLLMRLSPMAAPVMHPISVRVHHFFVPHRLIWDGWEDFITGGADGNNADTIPTLTVPASSASQRMLDYYGVPPVEGLTVSDLPRRGYNTIWNEFYRDQDLQSELNITGNFTVQRVSWSKDYFTTARPWEQKGDAVTIPIGDRADVVPTQANDPTFKVGAGTPGLFQSADSGSPGESWLTTDGTTTGAANWNTTGLEVDLTTAEAVNINEFRRAFALQRYQEARARYGSRYTEYLRYLGIRPSDARLQRPEYLGGGRVAVSISEILQTAPESADSQPPGATAYGVGDMYGHGIAAMRSNKYRRFFEEHGYVHSFVSVVPKTIYTQGIDKHWTKRDKEDFYQRELAFIGQQPIQNQEVYAQNSADDTNTFGYQDRYDEYRRTRSKVTKEYRDILNYWHLGREFSSLPVLNSSFIECVPSKRIFNEQTQDSLWCMAQHRITARRMIGQRSMSRII